MEKDKREAAGVCWIIPSLMMYTRNKEIIIEVGTLEDESLGANEPVY